MKIQYFSIARVCALPVLASLPMVAQADIHTSGMVVPAEEALNTAPHPTVYHSELLASNAVHAVFKGLRMLPVVKLDEAPSVEEVAVFEVKQNLAHRRYDRMGDGALQVGKLFSVTLASDVPGQDAALSDQLRQMQPGDEALMNIDHIYVFREAGNENVRPCTRFTRVQPRQPEAQPAAESAQPPTPPATAPAAAQTPAAAQPIQGPRSFTHRRSSSSQIRIESDGQGGMKRTEIVEHREWDPELNQEKVRKFINGVEVDPQTDQPLAAPAEPTMPQDTAPQPPAATQDIPIPEPSAS